MGLLKISGRALAVLGLGWVIALAWALVMLLGGAKKLSDYAFGGIQSGTSVPATSIAEVWSGWWPPIDGYRLSNAIRPDIAFVWKGNARSDCGITTNLFAAAGGQDFGEQLAWRLNSGPWNGPLIVGADATYQLSPVGDLLHGINVLTFRLPDAHVAGPTDTRLVSIALRDFRVNCTNK